MNKKEMEKLNKIALDSHYMLPVNKLMIEHSFKIFSRFICGGRILEMGPAEGLMTDYLIKITNQLSVVEASDFFYSNLKLKYPGIDIHHSLFEEFKPTVKYDYIILGHVLEHVVDPIGIVKKAKKWLNPDGKIIASVPNSRSLHRQAAVIMGILPCEYSMSAKDIHDGHRRIYNPETFRHVFISSDLKIEYFGGYWLKPLSNNQIESNWSTDMIQAFMRLGERYPDIAAEIYVVASKNI